MFVWKVVTLGMVMFVEYVYIYFYGLSCLLVVVAYYFVDCLICSFSLFRNSRCLYALLNLSTIIIS